ncbi:MAG: TRAP transporter small permease [Pseudomonadota bacterium]
MWNWWRWGRPWRQPRSSPGAISFGGEVKVDFATNHLPRRWIAFLDGLGSLLVGGYGCLAAWRTGALALSSFRNGESSAILGWPLWVPQSVMVPGFVLLALVGLHEAARGAAFSVTGTSNGKVDTHAGAVK